VPPLRLKNDISPTLRRQRTANGGFGFLPSPVIFFCDITTKYLDLQTRIQWLRSNYNSTEKMMKPRKITAKSGLPAAIAAMDFGIGLYLGAMAATSQ